MKKTLLLATLLILSGCASNYVRITEYGASTTRIPFVPVRAGGCQLSIEGTLTGRLIYQGETCSYDSDPGTDSVSN